MSKYELESLDLPAFEGRRLRAAAGFLERRMGQRLALPRLLKQGGIDQLRTWALAEPPTFVPLGETTPTHEGAKEPPPSPSLPFSCASDLAKAFRAGDTTPTDVAEKAIDAIRASEAVTPPLRALIHFNPDEIVAQARASEDRLTKGHPLGPLDGVPVVIKDELDQKGHPTTGGTSFAKATAKEDSTVAARLRAAGAVLLGKANMHEIGINPNGLNVHHGVARNPYDLNHDPGGSSSGSAAAVAAGICPIAIGADGGGSVRVPASHCGLVGLKPTYGRISEHGAFPIAWTLSNLGPLAQSVADAELAYVTIAGPDSHDPWTASQPPVMCDATPHLKGIRLGVYRTWFEHADREVVQANEKVLGVLREAGATLVDIEVPELNEMRIAHSVTILSEMAAAMRSHDCEWKDFGPATRISLAIGRSFQAEDYIRAQQMRRRAMNIFRDLYQQVDAIMTPASAVPAPVIPKDPLPHGWSNLSSTVDVMRYVVPSNFCGLPAISFPAGYTTSGLPIGAQAMASHWQEALLFRIARVAETAVERMPASTYRHLLEA